MSLHPMAGKIANSDNLIDIQKLQNAYFENHPDIQKVDNRVAFGTSGHRGTSLENNFNIVHIQAIAQSICDFRKLNNINGPLFLGFDTHALSYLAFQSVVEVLIANDVNVVIQESFKFTPTPVISHAILTYNKKNSDKISDGIIITPSHNPPQDGGIKYNPPHGGPAENRITKWIENRSNEILINLEQNVKKTSWNKAINCNNFFKQDFMQPYVNDLESIIDFSIIQKEKINIGVDPLGGSSFDYWYLIKEKYAINIEIVNDVIDPTFKFMHLDKDGKIRMDCSSLYAMQSLIKLKEKFDLSIGNDPDADRHGIVTKNKGLINPNHYLSVAVDYLLKNRLKWPAELSIGKTLVTSAMIDKIAKKNNRKIMEAPVGFKWFVDGLLKRELAFAGEESAGASFLRKNASVWTTDKDGIILGLLAAEITAGTKKDISDYYDDLVNIHGNSLYERKDIACSFEDKEKLKNLDPTIISSNLLAGEKIIDKQVRANGNNEKIGGLKVRSENGWFAARPSGTENIYKIYAESFNSKEHLNELFQEAEKLVSQSLNL